MIYVTIQYYKPFRAMTIWISVGCIMVHLTVSFKKCKQLNKLLQLSLIHFNKITTNIFLIRNNFVQMFFLIFSRCFCSFKVGMDFLNKAFSSSTLHKSYRNINIREKFYGNRFFNVSISVQFNYKQKILDPL